MIKKDSRNPSSRSLLSASVAAAALGMLPLTSVVADETFTLEEIVVTAQKRAQSIQDVPISVSAISGSKIAESGINDLADMSASIPNLKVTDGVTSSNVFIRGIGSGIDRGTEQSVGTFVDGIYMGRSRQLRSPFLDLDRVEVLRGPQGVLFGKNTIAGALKVETAKPVVGDEFSGTATAEYDEKYGGKKVTAVLSGSLSESFAARLALSDSSSDGYMKDTNLDRDEVDREETVARLSTVWEATENLTVSTKLEYAEGYADGTDSEISLLAVDTENTNGLNAGKIGLASYLVAASQAIDPQLEDKINYKKSTDEGLGEEFKEDRSQNFVLNLDYQLGEHTLTSITGYSAYKSEDGQDVDFLPVTWLSNVQDEDFDQISQEIRLTSPGGEVVDYIVGAYYQQNELDLLFDTGFGGATVLNAVAGACGGTNCGDVMRAQDYNLETESWSVFGEATWNLAEDLRASLGLRYSEETKEVDRFSRWADINDRNTQVDPAAPVTPGALSAAVLQGGFGVQATGAYKEERKEDHITPTLKVQWDINNDVMAYASAGIAYKSGGFNSAAEAAFEEMEYDEEKATGFEMGLKTTLLDGAANINVAAFYTKFDDLQISSFTGTAFLVSNAGSSISQGIEMDGKWRLTEEVTIGGSAAWLDAYYDENEEGPCTLNETYKGNTQCDLSGRETPYSPEWSGNVFVEYVAAIGSTLEFRAVVDMSFSGDYYLDGDLDSNLEESGYEKYNARFALASADDQWEVALVGKNLTDVTTSYWGTDVPQVGGSYVKFTEAPRTVAIQGRLNF
jgi:iron complex outermembrane recepter protein